MNRRSIAALALGGWLALVSSAAPAIPQTKPAETPERTAEYEKRLAAIRADIERLRGKLGADAKREKTVLSEIDQLAVKKRLLQSEWSLLQVQLTQTRADRDVIGRSIPEMAAALAEDRDQLARVLVTLYKHGRFSIVRYALAARDLRAFVYQVHALEAVAAAQDRTIAGFTERLKELGRADRALGEKELEISALTAQAASKRTELETEERRDKALIAQIKSNRKTYEQSLEELNRRAQELEDLIRRLEAQPLPAPLPGLPFAETRGKLAWPVGGKITQTYGLKLGAFNTKTRNNGIEITPPAGGDLTVKAIHSGKVVYADFFPSYGNLLILDHGGGYHSLYGHCAEFLVKNGDIVTPGTHLAVAGDTASQSGVSLYFEIRVKTKPVDPLLWLRRR